MKKTIIIAFLCVILASFGLKALVKAQNGREVPIKYANTSYKTAIFEEKISNVFNVKDLVKNSSECDTNANTEYFNALLANYIDTDKARLYKFCYPGQSQGRGVYQLIVAPNKLGYTDLEQFKEDFNVCQAGAQMYPYAINENNLVFTTSCGSGFHDDSNAPNGCEIIKNDILPTLILN